MFIRILILLSIFCSLTSSAHLFGNKTAFLSSEQAFIFSSQQHPHQLSLNWQIAEGYYLYQEQITIESNHAELGEWQFPASEQHNDEFFGSVPIFRQQLNLTIPIQSAQADATVTVHYQGCTKGLCYPPEMRTIPLQAVSFTQQFAKNDQNLTASPNESNHSLQSPAIPTQTQLANQLAHNRFSVIWFVLLGLGLAFTPCVLPMLPLLSAIVIGSRQRPNSWRAFLLSLTYVQGMALTYTLLGLMVAAIGLPFQVALQSPPVLIGFSILFILLALSMFGLFSLELPHRWQQKLHQLSQQQQGGSYPSVFVMGMIAGLVASPCTSAPLSGALLYVAQSGDLITGGLALYLLALGMGIPLMFITLFGNKILPKSGDWLLKVKTLFGFVMLALPIFLLSRLVSSEYEQLMWSGLAIAVLLWLNEQFLATRRWQKGLKTLLLFALILAGKPWADWVWQTSEQPPPSHFSRITTLTELHQEIAAHPDKIVMLDLYADWCAACKEFEKYTFSDTKVKNQLEQMRVLQVDMTRNSPENDAILQHFQILGLPTILFLDHNANELPASRISGFMPSELFGQWLANLPHQTP